MRYLIESALCLAAFYGLYHFILRRETFFQWNRAYLLLAPLLAMLLPLLNIRVEPPAAERILTIPEPGTAIPLSLERMAENPLTQAWQRQWQMPADAGWSISLWDVVLVIYAVVALLLLGALVWRFARLFSLLKKCRKQRSGDVVIASGDTLPPASFFSYVFWNEEAQKSDPQQFILEHEIAHARQWHSLDVLFMELMLIIQWFNPLMYAYRRSLSTVHEYIADEYVVRRTQQRQAYASLLVQQTGARARHGQLYNTFHSLIKQRLLMLIKRPSHPLLRAKYALALPVAALLMLLFSFRMAERLPAAKPFMQAIEKADDFVKTLDGITIVATAPRPPEKTPYIFYWGTMQCEIQYDPTTDRYFGEVVQSPEQWREGLRREPRLWNGTTLEQHLSLTVRSHVVRSDYYNEQLYHESRRTIEPYMISLTSSDVLILDNISLPNGKKATIRVLMDGEVPQWLAREKHETIWGTNMLRASDSDTELTWGGQPEPNTTFYTYEQLLQTLNEQPVITMKDGTVIHPDSAFFTVFGPRRKGIINERKSLDQIRTEIKSHRAELDDSCTVTINFPQAKGWVEFACRMVQPDDPRLGLKWSDRQKYVFEWGNIANNFGNCYAQSFDYKGNTIHADGITVSDRYSLKVKEALETFRLKPRLYRNEAEMQNLRFTLEYMGEKAEVINGVIPTDFLKKLENIKPYDFLTLRNIKADGCDLSHATIQHRIFSDLEKAALKTAKLTDGELRRQLAESMRVLPNPVSDVLQLQFEMPDPAPVKITLVHTTGLKNLQTMNYQATSGENRVELNVANLPNAGSYTIYLDTPFGRATAIFEKF